MKITEGMVLEFNKELREENCCFELDFSDTVQPSCEIVILNNRYVESYIINPTKEFRRKIEKFFFEKGIKLSSNNAGSIFWSNEMEVLED